MKHAQGVARRRWRLALADHVGSQVFYVASPDLVESTRAKERGQMNAADGLVGHHRRALQASGGRTLDQQFARLGDRHPLTPSLSDLHRADQLAQLCLSLAPRKAVTGRGCALGPDPALDLRGADAPLAVPRLTTRRILAHHQGARPSRAAA